MLYAWKTSYTNIVFVILTLSSRIFWASADLLVVNSENSTVDVFIDYELSFSAHIPNNGIQGIVTLANPEDACEPIAKPPFEANATLKWFVLIKRYPCALEEKVQYAKDSGYEAAIIYNKEPGGPQRLVPSGHLSLSTSIGIPAVLIGYDDAWSIRQHYLYDKGYIIVIYPETPFNISSYLLPFAIVVGACLFLMILFMVVKCLKDRRRRHRNRLSSRHLKQIPTTKYKKGDQYDVCAICLEEYNEGEKLRILPCSHAYHCKCIDPWLTNSKRTCPVCKRKVALNGCSSESDSDSDQESPSERTPLLRNLRGSNDGSGGGGTFLETTPNPNADLLHPTRHDCSSSPEESDSANIVASSSSLQAVQTAQVDFHSSNEHHSLEQSAFDIPDSSGLCRSVNVEANDLEVNMPSTSVVEPRTRRLSSDSSNSSTSRSSKRPELVV